MTVQSCVPHHPRAILFDFDGVIVDSARLKTDAFVAAYRDEPEFLRHKVREYQESHGGIGRRDKFFYFESVIFNRQPSLHRLDMLCSDFSRRVDEQILKVPLIRGAERALKDLLGKTEMHLVSGMPQAPLQSAVQRRGLATYFSSIIGSPTEKVDAFRNILDRSELNAVRCLAIGDSTTEYEAASKLGIPFLAIVPPAAPSPFPIGVETHPDLDRLVDQLGW